MKHTLGFSRSLGSRLARALWLVLFVMPLAPLVMSLCPHRARGEEAVELTVMTFNLRYASDRPPNDWPARRPVAQEMLAATSPDLIGTQEGLYRQLLDLEADLPAYRWIGLGREGGSRGEFMAVYYLADRFEPLAYDHFWLSDTPEVIGSATWGNTVRRMVTWVRFRERASGREFYFVNTHFDHQVQESREKSALLLRERLARFEPELPVIVVGDFNAAAEQNRVYDLLVGETELVDTWTAAAQRGEPWNTFHGYQPPRQDGIRIDWILSRGPFETLSSEVVVYERDGQYPSDHFPVVARLRLLAP